MNGKFNFIKLEKVIIRNFSLYQKKGKLYSVEEIINSGVYCLAGANGLGKTTFLNAINYGLTGIVLEPNREMYSPSEIVKENKIFTEKYFAGRINKIDESAAEIEILFSSNNKYFRIIRGFFERDGLRALEIYYIDKEKKIPCYESKIKSPKQLNEEYQKLLAQETGFNSFEDFIFYQLYVLTFDESRRMIFWDERASSHALAIAFNSDPSDAVRISDLIRKMERHESKGRNARWQATQIKNKIEELTQEIKSDKDDNIDKLEAEYRNLHEKLNKLEHLVDNTKIEYDTLLKNQSRLNSEIMRLKNEHLKLFSRYSKPRSMLLENVNVQLSIKKHECCLCGATGSQVTDFIERNIYKEKCPLCNTPINETNSEEQNAILKLIENNDELIYSKNSEMDNLVIELDGKKTELEKTEFEYQKVKDQITEFSESFPNVSLDINGDQKILSLIEQYRKQFELSDQESKEEYEKRDKLKPEYTKLLKKVELAYKRAEIDFVPTFKKLAKSFIGLDLNIQPKRNEKTIKLVLELKESARTQASQLSESQRFFLDIALRMALAIFLSKDAATMLIDTPEGSLDIAYESRVGNMFAEFIKSYGQNMIMTANINASQLLISLAEKCGYEKMKFRRMLEWTDPSIIQKEGELLFKKVYDNIDKALNNKSK